MSAPINRSTVSTEFLNRLAIAFKPVVYLEASEEYYPCSIEYFFENSVYCRDGKPLYPKGVITPQTLPSDAKRGDSLQVAEDFYNGPLNLHGVPIYGYPREVKKDDGTFVVQVTYCFIYTYNGPDKVFNCLPVGAHQGDVEHVTLELQPTSSILYANTLESYQLSRVYFGAHKSDDGQWVSVEDCEYTDGNQLIVYSARNSHASYPHSRVYRRCIGIADDITNRGKLWEGPIVIIGNETQWNMWPGKLGDVATPARHGWWEYENETSTNWFRRMFCICR